MSLPVAIRNTLLNNEALVNYTGNRIYNLRFPQDDTSEAVAFSVSNNVKDSMYAGTSVLLSPEVRLTLRAKTLAKLEDMRSTIHDQFNVAEVAVNEYGAVQCQIDDMGSEYDDALDVYHHYTTLNLKMRT